MKSGVAVITGASSGIGKACAELLHSSGFQVVNADKDSGGSGSEVAYVRCDVSDQTDINALYDHVKQMYGVPDVLISNAGVGVHEQLADGDPDKWARVINTNLMGPLRLIRAFLPEMIRQKRGHVVFVSSVAARKPHPYGGVYGASKAGLEMVAETLRLEVQPHIKVSVVAPGAIDTPFFQHTLSGSRDYTELGWNHVAAKDIARHILYLLTLPVHLNLDHTTIRPSDQPF